MSSAFSWFDNFLGVAYRYYDLRMNVMPLFSDRKEASTMWYENVHWWSDHDIKIRFVESGDQYWFVLASESRRPDRNMSFFKLLPMSENYARFKKGHNGEAFLRFASYSEKDEKDVKDDAVCSCGHIKEDHDGSCAIDNCSCGKFSTFEIKLLKKKKIVTDIKFLDEKDVKDDSLSWNCLYANKYKNLE
jgi:hypothetical protein